MEFLNRKTFFASLKAQYQEPAEGYFWDALGELRSFNLTARTSRRQLEAATLTLANLLPIQKPFVVFTDRIAGWSMDNARKRHSPVSVENLQDALSYCVNTATSETKLDLWTIIIFVTLRFPGL